VTAGSADLRPVALPTPLVTVWTGREARALRLAMRLTVREFARTLGVTDRVVSKWEAAGLAIQPRPFSQALLDTALARSGVAVKERFTALTLSPTPRGMG
jgi:DNA-binding transcriptional regulator YiaG